MKLPEGAHVLSDHQANTFALGAIYNLIRTIPAFDDSREGQAFKALVRRAIDDKSEAAVGCALGLLIAAAGAWEAELQAKGDTVLSEYDRTMAHVVRTRPQA